MMKQRVGLVATLLLVLGLALGGCSSPRKDTDVTGYVAVPDTELFAAISELPGVTRHTLSYNADSFGRANSYSGIVTARKGTDGRALLDQVLALLWQGHRGASYGVGVVVDGSPMLTPDRIGLTFRTDWPDRYGPQPGTGKPPEDKPLN